MSLLSNVLRRSGLALALGASFVACDTVTESTPVTAAAPTLAEASALGDIVAAANPSGFEADQGLLIRKNLSETRFELDLAWAYTDETGKPVREGSSIQTIKVSDDRPQVYATVDRPNSKGALVRVTRDGRDIIDITNNGMLVAPKGFDVVEEFGVTVVADFGGKAIQVFSNTAVNGRLPLVFTITDLGGERSSVSPVFAVDVLDDLFATLVLEIDIDIRWLIAFAGNETLNQRGLPLRIDLGDTEAKTYCRVSRGTAPLTKNALRPRPTNDVVHR